MRRNALAAGLLSVVAVSSFGPSLWSAFAADDFLLRYASLHSSFTRLFTSDPLAFAGGGNFYRPIWFAFDDLIGQVSAHPALFHLANVLVYVAVVLEVWLLLRLLVAPVPAVAAALLFAAYPRHSETVAWVAGSSDLLAALFGLAALLVALQKWHRLGRLAAVALLAGAAAGSKESAFVLVPLFVVVQVGLGRSLTARSAWTGVAARRAVWEPAGAMIAGQLAALALRFDVLHKLGGYPGHPWSPGRMLVAAASDVVAAASAPQLPLLRDLALLAVPALVWVLVLALGARTAVVRPERRRLMAVGLAFAVVALLPTLNVAINLDTSVGERFLFLPSIGLAIVAGAALDPAPGLRQLMLVGVAAAMFVAVSIDSSLNWQRAGALGSHVVRQVTALAQAPGEVLLLDIPETYDNGHVLAPGLDAAVALQGGSARVAWCSQVELRDVAPHQIEFRSSGPGSYVGLARGSARFHFLLSGATDRVTPDCSYGPGPSRPHLGSASSVAVRATPAARPVRYAYFDGKDVVAVSSSSR